jgi:quinol monooxygenase YgiN
MSDQIIRFVIKFSVAKEKVSDVKRLLGILIERCKEEPGLLCYEWFFNDDETELYAHEWYVDSAAVGAHMEVGGAELEKLLEAAPPNKVDVYGNLTAELREELAPFNPNIVPYWRGFSRP